MRTQVSSGWGWSQMASRQHDALDVLNVSDFKPQVDLWLFHPRFLGNLQEPVELFGEVAGHRSLS